MINTKHALSTQGKKENIILEEKKKKKTKIN